ncbi:MAG: type IV pilin protein, partial [Aquabacterium sp.]
VPSYSSYVQRSRVPTGLDMLTSFATRMEQLYQDSGSYSVADACGVAAPTVDNFTISCALANGGQAFTATATGSGRLTGYSYTINSNGVRATTAHPKGVPSGNCWSIKGGACDT